MKKFVMLAFTFALFAAPAFAQTAAPAATPAAAPTAKAAPADAAATAATPAAKPATQGIATKVTAPVVPVENLSDEEVEDVLKGIVIHKHADDFAGVQQLALQNRQERREMLDKSTECVQTATKIEDIYACQIDERKALDKIWLSYCDTSTSFLNVRRAGKKNPNRNPNGNDNAEIVAKPKATECDRAMAAVTGRPIAQPKGEADTPAQ